MYISSDWLLGISCLHVYKLWLAPRYILFTCIKALIGSSVRDQLVWGALRNKLGCTCHVRDVTSPLIMLMNRRIIKQHGAERVYRPLQRFEWRFHNLTLNTFHHVRFILIKHLDSAVADTLLWRQLKIKHILCSLLERCIVGVPSVKIHSSTAQPGGLEENCTTDLFTAKPLNTSAT